MVVFGCGKLLGRRNRLPHLYLIDDFDAERFQGDNFQRNLDLADRIRWLAAERGVSPAQLALAWLLAQGEDIVPIPGTKRVAYLEENAAASEIELTREDLERIDAAAPAGATAGERYPDMSTIDA